MHGSKGRQHCRVVRLEVEPAHHAVVEVAVPAVPLAPAGDVVVAEVGAVAVREALGLHHVLGVRSPGVLVEVPVVAVRVRATEVDKVLHHPPLQRLVVRLALLALGRHLAVVRHGLAPRIAVALAVLAHGLRRHAPWVVLVLGRPLRRRLGAARPREHRHVELAVFGRQQRQRPVLVYRHMPTPARHRTLLCCRLLLRSAVRSRRFVGAAVQRTARGAVGGLLHQGGRLGLLRPQLLHRRLV
mmetsp:Transcript_1386/g.3009  ORF Transcript_1386/g.3009 Transcript_1386/m.3009 type:complete len:242 (-) Transcript_1386:445-1170(-)